MRAVRWNRVAVAFAAAALVSGCAVEDSGRRGGPEPTQSVVLVTIDTLRADHLGYDGYPRPTSPFLDRLAARSVVFRRAYTPMPTTVPAHLSLFTSLYPIQHRVLKNGWVAGTDALTWAEILREAGYQTAGFVSTSIHFGPSRLDQGFEVFDEPEVRPGTYRGAGATVERTMEFLRRSEVTKGLFLWVHLFDPHPPYDEGNRLPIEPGDRAELTAFLVSRHPEILEFYGGREDDLLEVVERYDGEIRAADRALQRLFGMVEESLGSDRVLWVVTSDHGEGLGAHGWMGHGKHLYNEQVRVPLLFRLPGRGEARESFELVELVDVLPTVLEVLGVPLAQQEQAVLMGRSLVPALHGRPLSPSRSGLAQRRHYDPANKPSDVPLHRANFEPGSTFAIHDEHYKYVLRSAGEDELFDMTADFSETRNLVGVAPAVEQEYRERLLKRIRELRSRSLDPATTVDEEALDALRALGYVQ